MNIDDKTQQIFTDGIKQAVKMREQHNGSDDFMMGVFVQYCEQRFNEPTIVEKIKRKPGRPKGTKKGASSVTKLNRDRLFLNYLLLLGSSKITQETAVFKIGKKYPELQRAREHLSEVIHDDGVKCRSLFMIGEAIQEIGGVNSGEDLIKAIEQAQTTMKNHGEKNFY